MPNEIKTNEADPKVPVRQMEIESVSEVDREPPNGGQRDSNWRDRREMRTKTVGADPHLEDGAD